MLAAALCRRLLFAEDGLLISTFGEDEAGELYVAAYQSGQIYQLVAR